MMYAKPETDAVQLTQYDWSLATFSVLSHTIEGLNQRKTTLNFLRRVRLASQLATAGRQVQTVAGATSSILRNRRENCLRNHQSYLVDGRCLFCLPLGPDVATMPVAPPLTLLPTIPQPSPDATTALQAIWPGQMIDHIAVHLANLPPNETVTYTFSVTRTTKDSLAGGKVSGDDSNITNNSSATAVGPTLMPATVTAIPAAAIQVDPSATATTVTPLAGDVHSEGNATHNENEHWQGMTDMLVEVDEVQVAGDTHTLQITLAVAGELKLKRRMSCPVF
ncbi:hypothetical protein C8F01DRAFT_724350 [Mycena amicta]|nr:hypothetical protein C8F01DRAFT_724350 [Mycena amicta]